MKELDNFLKQQNHELSKAKLKDYNSLVFAFLGDSIHTLFIRSMLVMNSTSKVGSLHKKTSEFVKASAQAKALDAIMNDLTEEELRIVKTARNSHSKTVAKNASLEDYKKATSFEALIGYLYLLNETQRMNKLLQKSLSYMENL